MYKIIMGIYEIRNIQNGHRYIGGSTNVSSRWNEHKRMLRNGKHHSPYLQRAWLKYGESSFVFEIICPVNKKVECIPLEQEYIDKLQPEYNIAPKAISPGGFNMTDAIREKHRQNSLRLKNNPDWMKKCTEALARGQVAAVAWHRSSIGREWAKKNYEKSLAITHVEIDLICIQCGKNYKGEKGKFCSGKCQSKWRRLHKVDNENRICVTCGKEFSINKYSKTKTCSRSCSQSNLIIQFDKQGKELGTFKNAFDAMNKTGVGSSSISKCCKGRYSHAGGFIWRYAPER